MQTLDYSIVLPEERTALVKQIIDEIGEENLTQKQIQTFSDYIISAVTKQEKKKKEILTENRLYTINKRETSYEGLVSKFENGEDGVYNLFSDSKGVLLAPKIEITEEDIAEIPELADFRNQIAATEAQFEKASGKDKYRLKKQLIDMHRDQYVIKAAYKPVVGSSPIRPSAIAAISLEEHITMDENDEPVSDGAITLFNPTHIVLLLHNYSALKQECWGTFHDDLYYLMEDLDNLIEQTLKNKYPLYYTLTVAKIEKQSNAEIQSLIEKKFGIKHSIEYLSSLWCKKIPKILREQAKENYILYYYTEVKRGKWKRCSRCGQVKLRHNRFFSKNATSKDGYYSICKECRKAKARNKNKGSD